MSGPSDLLLALLVPVSGLDMRQVSDLRQVDNRAIQRQLTECMAEAGFKLSFMRSDPPDLVSRMQHFPHVPSVEKYGFVADEESWQSPGEAALAEASIVLDGGQGSNEASMSTSYARALLDSYPACSAEVVDPPIAQFEQDHRSLHVDWMERMIAAEQDSGELARAWDRWMECMAEHSWEVTSEDDFFLQLDGLVLERVNEAGYSAGIAASKSAAEDYLGCLPIVAEVRQPLRTREREAFVSENYAALLEAEARLRDVLSETGRG